jgi:hypothetical protein
MPGRSRFRDRSRGKSERRFAHFWWCDRPDALVEYNGKHYRVTVDAHNERDVGRVKFDTSGLARNAPRCSPSRERIDPAERERMDPNAGMSEVKSFANEKKVAVGDNPD